MNCKNDSLTSSLVRLSMIPLLLLGTGILIVSSYTIYKCTSNEIRNSLMGLANAISITYESVYHGDYTAEEGSFKKGIHVLDNNFSIIDQINETSGADITIFYEDKRMLTSVRNNDGSRVVGTLAAKEVSEEVLNKGNSYFSNNVSVNGEPYFGYYMPLKNSDQKISGMVFAGKSRKSVIHAVSLSIVRICLMITVVLSAASLLALKFARDIITSLNKTKKFLGSIAEGDLSVRMDPCCLNRKDELGEMARFAAILQDSITELVGTDPLTGLYNRRSCQIVLANMMQAYQKNKVVFGLAIGDIDWFKLINDNYGHQAGDKVLKNLAAIFKCQMEKQGFVFRWGGEEFLFVFECMDIGQIKQELEKLQEVVRSSKVEYAGQDVVVSMTIGAAECTLEDTLETLLKRADDNLYTGKQCNKNQIVC